MIVKLFGTPVTRDHPMRLKTSLSCLLFAVTTTGCMYHGNTPIAKAPTAFSVDNTTNPAINLPDHPWWQEIGSTELNGLVVEALENNREVAIASKNIEIAQSALDTVRLGWLPTINLMGGRFNSDGLILLPNLPVPLAGTGNFFAFLPTWVANIIQLPNQTRQAQKKVDITAADYLALRASIAAQVVSSYALLLASIEEDRILADLQKNVQSQLNTTRAMTSQGLRTQIAINEQDSELLKLQSQAAINKSNIIAAKNALLTLLGRPIEAFTPTATFSSLKLNHIAPGNTPASVLATRPDVAAARAKIEAADYGISSAASQFAPTLMLATANLSGNASGGGESLSLSETVQLGIATLSLNPQFIGQINTANKQYDSAVINYLKTVDNALKEVDNALAEFAAKQTMLVKEEQTLANSRQNLATYRAMLSSGLLSETQYRQTATQFDLASMAIVQAKIQAIISLSKLYQSMGGGTTYQQADYRLQDQSIVWIDREHTKN